MGNSRSVYRVCVAEMPKKAFELHCAVMSNDKALVLELVMQGVDVNYPWKNPSCPSVKDGSTPLLCAVSLNHIEIAEMLLASGARVNQVDRNGCTPLYKAAFHGRPMLIDQLAKSGADVNLADNSGRTPLYICINNAIVHSCKQAVLKLINAGALVDKSDQSGQAPLHVAAHWKLVNIVQLLLNAHSTVNLVDHKGHTPLYLCVRALSTKLYMEDIRHQLPCICVLFQAGADMLNLVEWLLHKGPGIRDDVLSDSNCKQFVLWYRKQVSTPSSLKNQCRKVIQKTLEHSGNLLPLSRQLPLPAALQTFVSRKMFFQVSSCP